MVAEVARGAPRSLEKRAPRGLAHVARGRGQSLLDTTVAGDCGQYTTAPGFRRVDDQLAVGCDARRFVERALGQDLHLPRREILQRDIESSAVATHEHESSAVGKTPWRNVVAAVVGHPLDRAAAERQPVNLRAGAAARRKQYRPAVGGKDLLGVDSGGAREPLHATAVGVDQVELRSAVLGEEHDQSWAVRGPGRGALSAG